MRLHRNGCEASVRRSDGKSPIPLHHAVDRVDENGKRVLPRSNELHPQGAMRMSVNTDYRKGIPAPAATPDSTGTPLNRGSK